MNNLSKKTPLEIASGQEILSPEDIIHGWEGASKLIYCYKNDLNLIEWLSLLSDKFIEDCVNKKWEDLDEEQSADWLQIGLYLEMLKKKSWAISVSQKTILKNISQLLTVCITMESINRKVKKEWGKDSMPGTGNLINMMFDGKNKYSFSSYSSQTNPLIEIEVKDTNE